MTVNDSVLTELDISLLDEPKKNPNKLPEARYKLLVEAIRKVGFLQPILVRGDVSKPNSRFEIVDGVHRVRAAKELGMRSVECVVSKSMTSAEATVIQIGMNRLRGELEFNAVSAALSELAMGGWTKEQLTITGFELDEIEGMLRDAAPDNMDEIAASLGESPPTDVAPAEKPFVLELTFATRAELARAKRGLRKASGGRGGDMAIGLLKILEGA